MKMNDKLITALEAKGFKRWTKEIQRGALDRLYINADALGLEVTYRKTGSIFEATFRGERVSNGEGYRMKAAKTYVDVTTGEVYSTNDTLREAAEALLAEAMREIEDEEAAGAEQAEAEQIGETEGTEEDVAICEVYDVDNSAHMMRWHPVDGMVTIDGHDVQFGPYTLEEAREIAPSQCWLWGFITE